jgi:hypothetical protein
MRSVLQRTSIKRALVIALTVEFVVLLVSLGAPTVGLLPDISPNAAFTFLNAPSSHLMKPLIHWVRGMLDLSFGDNVAFSIFGWITITAACQVFLLTLLVYPLIRVLTRERI